MFTNKRQYKPNLATLMTLSQSNYMLLLRLLADREVAGEQREFLIAEQLAYRLKVLEVTRYTSVVSISQISLLSQAGVSAADANDKKLNKLLTPSMEIRLYHDAQVIDILASQNISGIKPRYDYPNVAMHQPDEKQQSQLFLKEWLQLCLEQGYEATDFISQQQAS